MNLSKFIKRFIARLNAPYSKDVIVWNIYHTDLVHPEYNANFARIAPYVHLYPKYLKYIGGYGNLANAYSRAVLRHFNNKLPFEIEQAVIEDSHPNLVWNMTDAGHIWSCKAAELMKEHNKIAYDDIIITRKKVRD
ncbi:MAG: hypothetical protein J6N49_00195 [Alphaproteobacteria bacterium]|nr:hypothetical protein [Alphaproteobacteria bacterium]